MLDRESINKRMWDAVKAMQKFSIAARDCVEPIRQCKHAPNAFHSQVFDEINYFGFVAELAFLDGQLVRNGLN